MPKHTKKRSTIKRKPVSRGLGDVYKRQDGNGGYSNDGKVDGIGALFELEQFADLKDVSGKDIYEGDIVKSNYKYAQPNISQIIMEDGNSYITGEDLATGNEMLVSDHIGEIEVIGNVHENPELLKG